MGRVLDLWKHADIAYEEPTGKESLFTDCRSFTRRFTELDFAYIAEYPDEIIISFRGTDSKDMNARALKTWISNFNAYPLQLATDAVKAGANNVDALHKAGILEAGSWGEGTIHKSFYESWIKFKDWVDDWFISFTDPHRGIPKKDIGSIMTKTVTVTGHSRGGTIAELCTRHLAKNCGIQNTCIEFAAPAAGIKAYRHEFRLLPCYGTLVVNGLDIVPDMPPEILGFRHGAFRETMPAPWYENLARPVFRIADHLPDRYSKRLPDFYD